MKNTIKMSLVAAVAVAGLTTSATAGSLSDAIQDTTISGKALIGYNYKDDARANTTTNTTEYDLDITLNTKVNDTITFTTGIEADHDINTGDDSTDAAGGGAVEKKGSYIGLTKLYFTAKTDVATVMIGKQKQPTPFLDDERGDGVVALIPAGPVTIAAGYFTGMNGGQNLGLSTAQTAAVVALGATSTSTSLKERDITALAAIAKVGPANVQAWYLNASNSVTSGAVESGLSGYSLMADVQAGPVAVNVTHSSLALDGLQGVDFDNETLTKVVVSGKVEAVNLVAGFGMTNDASHNSGLDNTRLHGVDLTSDNDAKTNMALDQIKLDNYNDANAILVGASMKFGATTVGANYLMATVNGQNGAADTDGTELDLNVKYAMSKNFSISGLYAATDIDNTQDTTHMELSLNYKF